MEVKTSSSSNFGFRYCRSYWWDINTNWNLPDWSSSIIYFRDSSARCMYNLGNRIITDKIATKDREKIEKLHKEIAEMQKEIFKN